MGSIATPSSSYSPVKESERIFDLLCEQAVELGLPPRVAEIRKNVQFESDFDRVYFPIPFKETETVSALKALEGSVAAALADLKTEKKDRQIKVNLEKATSFLFQAYLATVGGLGKLDKNVKSKLKNTDLLAAQSDPYRRMSANLYETKEPGQYYHIHGSLEASTTLKMIGLEPFRPDLKDHDAIIGAIEPAVKNFTVPELEGLNAKNRQAGVPVLEHKEFLKTPHGQVNIKLPPWNVDQLESTTPPTPLPPSISNTPRILEGIKVLELCRIIAGPTITRILGEYGATVLKVTSPNLSDVPFFQVDGNMGKHATDLDLKTPGGKQKFEELLKEVDIVVDGYRPGALEKLGYGPKQLAELGVKRGKGVVYVNENCFGYEGEWANRPGWQQIADCVSGVAWAQGTFMKINEPMVPPFPISDYGTGCIGAIAALTGLYNRTIKGGSYHGKASLLQYDLLLFRAGLYTPELQAELYKNLTPEFLALRHSHSVDQISGTTLQMMQNKFGQELFNEEKYCERWFSGKYGDETVVVKPVVEIQECEIGWVRGTRPNGSDEATWDFRDDGDEKR